MSALAQFGLIALLPAALGAAAPSGPTLAVSLCSGASVRVIEVPLEKPGRKQAPCCAKGCHGGSSRKKLAKAFEPSQ